MRRKNAGIGESIINDFLIKFTATKFFSHIVYLGKRMPQQVAAGRPTEAYEPLCVVQHPTIFYLKCSGKHLQNALSHTHTHADTST